jgi:hypothetical protein
MGKEGRKERKEGRKGRKEGRKSWPFWLWGVRGEGRKERKEGRTEGRNVAAAPWGVTHQHLHLLSALHSAPLPATTAACGRSATVPLAPAKWKRVSIFLDAKPLLYFLIPN